MKIELWTVRELAAYLRVAPATVYTWNHKGTGPKVTHVGRSVRYSPEDVQQWMAQRSPEYAATLPAEYLAEIGVEHPAA